ncbi:Kelch repeat-containing protein [Nakamurella alba]|nr:hypothetical protein [Nakamurella alba]
MTDHDLRTALAAEESHAPDSSAVLATVRRGIDVRFRRRRRIAVLAAAAVVVLLAGTLAVAQFRRESVVEPISPPTETSMPVSPAQPTGVTEPSGVTAEQLAAGHWSAIPDAPIAPRFSAASTWTGSEMLVWGGLSSGATGDDPAGDGAAYNPATHTWRTLPAAPISARYSPATVWTGSEFLIIGGTGADGPEGDGAAYTPSTNTWRTLPAAPLQPSTSQQLIMVGAEVMVASVPPSDAASGIQLALLDPTSMTWQTLPSPTLPAGHVPFAIELAGDTGGAYLWAFWESKAPSGGAPETSAGSQTGVDGFRIGVATRATAVGIPEQQRIRAPIETGSGLLQPPSPPRYPPFWSVPMPSLGPGFLFDPATGASTDIAAGPWDDINQSFVWTGAALMSVNGTSIDASPDGQTNTTGLAATWDPTTDEWTELPPAPAWGPAVQVWTGTSLLMWGPLLDPSATGWIGTPPTTVSPDAPSGLEFIPG